MFLKSIIKAYLIFVWVVLLAITITNVLISIPIAVHSGNGWWLLSLLAEPLLIVLLKYLFTYIFGGGIE